jgi:hypothetical protein
LRFGEGDIAILLAQRNRFSVEGREDDRQERRRTS